MIDIDDSVIKDIKTGFNLPPKPELLSQLQDPLKEPGPDLHQIAKLSSTNIAMSAAVLTVLDPSSYGMARTITNIRQAVMILGLDSITNLYSNRVFNQTSV